MDQSVVNYGAGIPRGFKFAGAWWPGCMISVKGLRELKYFPLLKDDVIIISYPKSGTTWLSEIVSGIMNNGDIRELQKLNLHVRVKWLEVEAGKWHTGIMQMAFLFARVLYQLLGLVNRPTGKEPRTFFTHVPFELLPQKILDGHCKVLYVARNPKDIMVSAFHYYKIARYLGQQKDLDWDTFYDWFCKGEVYNGSWFDHVKPYWNMYKFNKGNWLFLTYEQMKRDPFEVVSLVSSFLNKQLPQEVIETIVNHTNFDEMKNNKFTQRKGFGAVNETEDNTFYRKGDVGDWKNYFSKEQSEKFDKLLDKNLIGFEDMKKTMNFQYI